MYRLGSVKRTGSRQRARALMPPRKQHAGGSGAQRGANDFAPALSATNDLLVAIAKAQMLMLGELPAGNDDVSLMTQELRELVDMRVQDAADKAAEKDGEQCNENPLHTPHTTQCATHWLPAGHRLTGYRLATDWLPTGYRPARDRLPGEEEGEEGEEGGEEDGEQDGEEDGEDGGDGEEDNEAGSDDDGGVSVKVEEIKEMLQKARHEDFCNVVPTGKCGACIARGEEKPRNAGYSCFSCNVRVCWHPDCLRDHLALNLGNKARESAPLVRKERTPASGERKCHFREEEAPAPAPAAARKKKRTR